MKNPGTDNGQAAAWEKGEGAQRPHPPDWTIRKLLAWAADYFESHHIDSPRSAAEILLAHGLKLRRIDLYTQFDKPLNKGELAGFKNLIKRRLNREPVAYIVGHKGFWNLDLAVSRHVLIPRPETECLVEAALAVLPETAGLPGTQIPNRVLELGTGSGAVILSLAAERPAYRYFASDRSVRAIAVARGNARCNEPVTGGDTVNFFLGDWFQPLRLSGAAFQLILSNPPYIPTGQIARLQPEIRCFEPELALDGARDGLGCLRHLIDNAPVYLAPGGVLLLEIGHDQRAAVEHIIDDRGCYQAVEFFKDYHGSDRVVRMQKR